MIQPTDSTQTELSPTFSMRHGPNISIRYRKQLVPPTIDQDEPIGAWTATAHIQFTEYSLTTISQFREAVCYAQSMGTISSRRR